MPSIGDIFLNGIKNITDQPSSKVSEDGNAKLAAMKNGDTFQAKVISSEGSDVTLRLPGGETVNARLSSNMALTEGQTVSFEVKNSGSSVSISPLLTNTSADISVLKALDYAQLPVTNETSQMTLEMMKAGLPIDRSSLLSMYESVRSNPGADITNIIDLTKLGIEVNDTNLQNIESYKNLSYQIDQGMQTLSELTDKALLDMVRSGNEEGAARVFDTLIASASEYASNGDSFDASPLNAELKEILAHLSDDGKVLENAVSETVSDKTDLAGDDKSALSQVLSENSDPVIKSGDEVLTEEKGRITDGSDGDDASSKALKLLRALQESEKDADKTSSDTKAAEVNKGLNADDIKGAVADNAPKASFDLKTSVSETISLLRELNNDPEYKPSDIQTLLDDLRNAYGKASTEGNTAALKNLLSSDPVRNLVFNVLKDGWKVSPSDVADKEKVEALYKRLDNQLNAIKDSLSAAGASGTEAFKAADNMKSNVDFLQQINQMYAYIQLPLKLSGGDTAHGDLYVYSNKKNMTSDDSKVTAFLHLDMDNLGPVDVYVSMDLKAGGKVSTNFTVADDETLDLLNEYMDQLTDRLKKRGYDVSCSMKIKGDEPDPEEEALEKGGVNFLLMHSGLSSSGYSAGMRSFDVRA